MSISVSTAPRRAAAWLAAALACVAISHAAEPKPAGDRPAAPGDGAAIPRETRDISGWQVHVSRKLLEAEADATARALTGLKQMLDEIARVVPASAVAELRKVPLYFSSAYKTGRSGAEFHPDAGWLRDNGRDPAMVRSVEFSGVEDFEAEMRRMPNFALHELAHAYHFRALKDGFGNADIKAAYESAKASGSYDRVERSFGEGNGKPNTFERAYAMNNPMEYFAETTEAYFSRNDFFPFTREQLKKHDPAIFTLLGKLWGVPETNLTQAESRLRAIYDRDEFRPQSFRGDWLPDSSGYTVLESAPDATEKVRARYDVASGKRTVLDAAQKEKSRRSGHSSPDGQSEVVAERGNLYVHDLKSDRKIPLTKNAPDGPVSNHGAAWSPDGKWIAFVQSNESDVKLRPVLVPGDPSYPEVRQVRFARVGGTIPTLRVGVVDSQGKETRWLPIPMPAEGFYLGPVEWAGNSQELLIEKLSRFRNEREFLLADIRTGALRRIFHEANQAWVDGSQGSNAGWTWIRGGQAFIVLSEKDGWRHAYVYSREGKERALLTPGRIDIIERAVVDEGGGWYYFYASPDNATQKYLYRVRLDGTGAPERVTPQSQPGTHNYVFSPDAQWAFHTYSTFDNPPVTELVKLSDHQVVRMLESNDELRQKMKPLISQPTEFLQLDIGGGVVLDAWMIKPTGFDPSKQYPVLVHVYGEPYSQTVLDVWGRNHADYHRAMADLGYLVVSIDNRGTPAPKGAAWRRAIFGSLGPLSTEEQAAALKELARTRPYVDASRVAIWGWSGGGSNTLNAMFRKPDVYQVGIAVAPKPQPHLYNAWFQEIYMQTPETNPDGYRRAAPINFAEGLKGSLLIIHGTGESNTHLQITEGLVDRLIELGKRFDYMAYPNRDHGLREGRGTETHLHVLMARYLIEHLPPGPR